MKAEILKIAGVKSEKEFYKKFPTEEAFQKAHGKEFKKAKLGAAMVPKAQDGDDFGLGKLMKEYAHKCGAQKAAGGPTKAERKEDRAWDKANAKQDAIDAAEAARASANAINMRYNNIGDKLEGADYKARKQAYNDFVKSNATFAKDPSYTGKLSPEERYTLLDNTLINMRRDPTIPNSYRDRLTKRFNITDPSKVGISEMLNYANQMGGADKFREWYDAGGPEIQKYGGETKKLNQLTNFTNDVDGIMPIAQDGSMIGSYMGGQQQANPDFVDFGAIKDKYDYAVTGKTDAIRKKEADAAALAQAAQSKGGDSGGGGGMDLKGIMGMFGGSGQTAGASDSGDMSQIMGMLGKGRDGKKVPKYQFSGQGVPLGGVSGGINYDPGAGGITGNAQPGGAMVNPNLNPPALNMGSIASGGVGTTQEQINATNAVNDRTKIVDPTKAGIDKLMKYAGPAGKIVSGIKKLDEEKKQRKRAEATANISALTLQASNTMPEQIKRQYVRPEDQVTSANQLFPTYGVGTNYLSRNGSVVRAEDGMQVGGNLGEIQNTYAPNTLYDDLGYEPLSDSDIIKQYRAGGFINRMQGGGATPWGAIGNMGQDIGQTATGNNAGGEIGGEVGGQVGGGIGFLIGGPAGQKVGKAIGQTVGAVGGGLLDKNPKKMAAANKRTAQNVETAAVTSGMKAAKAQYSAFVRNGGDIPYAEDGWVSHDWQPQVITQFGEHSMKDLLKRDPMMDTLRTGGHITQNNMFPTDQYALGGELKTTWGGYAEPISYNPYMPGSGETVMFRGKSHEEGDGKGHTGIGVKYGDGGHDSYTDYAEYGSENADADVEVERGEPAMEMIDGETGEKNMVVFGNLKIPNQFLDQIGDVKAKGKKFKNYVADLGKIEERQNKIIEKSTNELDNLDVYTPFDKLKFDALQANINGANMKLKESALKKSNAAAVQNAINDTAAEHMVDADHLAKGKVKIDKKAMKEQQARFGKEIFKAQNGTTTTQASPLPKVSPDDYEKLKKLYEQAEKTKKGADVEKFQKEYYKVAPEYAEKIIREAEPSNLAKSKGYTKADLQKLDREKLFKTNNNIFGNRTKQFFTAIKPTPIIPPPPFIVPDLPTGIPNRTSTTDTTTQIPTRSSKTKYDKWIDLANTVLPYIRPTDQESFDYAQLYPEMAAASMNQLEPVKAQLYRPELNIPYDISLQDQMNANQADFNAIQRKQGYSPEALATLAAQKYSANSKVLGEQFRLNQAEKAGVYEGNRAILNDAQLKNLGILDTQMVRQETAKSKTKEQALEIMKSMSDKIAKNKLENRMLGIYENLYNYRFDPSGRAVNMNGPVRFNGQVPGAYGTSGIPPTATNPYVSGSYSSTTPQGAGSSQNLPQYIDRNAAPYTPPTSPFFGGYQAPLMPGVTINAPRPPYISLPTLEELYQDEMAFPVDQQRKGGKTKKNNKNGNIVKAIKNL